MAELSALHTQVLLAAFGLAFVFGAIVQRTHFCIMGALSDFFNFGSTLRLRQWALAAGVAMLGFWGLVALGQLDPARTLYAGTRWIWLSALVGGALFGFGMVLASGCGSRNLVRIGAGSLKALVVMVMLGLAAFATLRGITAVLRVATVDRVAVEFATPALLPMGLAGLLGVDPRVAGLALALLLGGALVAWALAARPFRSFDNLLAGFGIGLVIVAAWWLTGHFAFLAEHPETLEETFVGTQSGRAEAFSFVAPVAHAIGWLLFYSDANEVLTVGVVAVAGVVAGACAVALARREFRWEGFAGTEDVANHLAGGLLMGVGGVTAFGCTIGQGLSGLSTLSATSFLAVAGIVAGAWLALRWQGWRLERMA